MQRLLEKLTPLGMMGPIHGPLYELLGDLFSRELSGNVVYWGIYDIHTYIYRYICDAEMPHADVNLGPVSQNYHSSIWQNLA